MTGGVDAGAFTRFERHGWSRAAEGYHQFFSAVTGRVVEPLLDAARVAAGASVLDVATGPGDLAARAAARGATVIGVDIAEPVVALAARLNPGLDFRRADAHALPFADGAFTAVVANFLLPHLEDHERAAAAMTRVLAPGGWLAVSTWEDVPERAAVLGVVVAAVAEAGVTPPAYLPAGPPFFAYSHDDMLVGLLRGAGLREVGVRRLSFTHRVDSPDELWDGVLAGTVRTSELVTSQPPDVRQRIRFAFDRLAAEHAVDDALELPVSVKIAFGCR